MEAWRVAPVVVEIHLFKVLLVDFEVVPVLGESCAAYLGGDVCVAAVYRVRDGWRASSTASFVLGWFKSGADVLVAGVDDRS